MKGYLRRTLRVAGMVLAMACMAFCLVAVGGATKAEAAEDCKIGFKYESNAFDENYYEFKLDKEKLVSIEVEGCDLNDGDVGKYRVNVQTPIGAVVIAGKEFFIEEATEDRYRVKRVSKILNPGTYELYIHCPFGLHGGSFIVTTYDPVTLKNFKITEVDSKKKGTLTVTVPEKDEDAEHIEVEYATNPDFTDAQTVEVPESGTVTIKKLEKGKKYYVRARQVAYYGNGGMSVSAWTVVKSKVVSKK
ncbi:MAG: hypothetical protein K6G81_11415 [Lachnospiraceae bacterium]|nr:hypothetical protein [Lachnospiraceae bacterium]